MSVSPRPRSTPVSALGRAREALASGLGRLRDASPAWVGGALAGLQAGLFSLALVLIPVWVIVAAAPEAGSWDTGAGIATRVWLTSFGVPWAVESVPVSLMPLGVTGVTVLMLAALTRQFGASTWVAGAAAVATFAATVGLAAASAWSEAPDAANRTARAVVVAVLLAVPAVAWAALRSKGAQLSWMAMVPATVRWAVRAATAMVAGVLVLGAGAGAVLTVAHRHGVADAATALAVTGPEGVALAFMEALYVPNVALWLVGWLSGAGLAVGDRVIAAGAATGPVPDIPLLAALPGAGVGWWGPVAVAAVGGAVAVTLRSRGPQGLHGVAALSGAVVAAGGVLGCAQLAARGAIGPGALQGVGADSVTTGVLVAAQLGAGALAALVLVWVWTSLRGRVTGAARQSGQGPRPQTRSGTAGRPPGSATSSGTVRVRQHREPPGSAPPPAPPGRRP